LIGAIGGHTTNLSPHGGIGGVGGGETLGGVHQFPVLSTQTCHLLLMGRPQIPQQIFPSMFVVVAAHGWVVVETLMIQHPRLTTIDYRPV
jgi:hypothetical protein